MGQGHTRQHRVVARGMERGACCGNLFVFSQLTGAQNINGAFKYVFLGAGSSLKGRSDLKKYERARELKVSRILPLL